MITPENVDEAQPAPLSNMPKFSSHPSYSSSKPRQQAPEAQALHLAGVLLRCFGLARPVRFLGPLFSEPSINLTRSSTGR